MANSKQNRANKNKVPRYVVQIFDTETIRQNGKGEKSYLNVSAASDNLSDFIKPYTSEQSASHKGANNEFESMILFFKDDVTDAKLEEVINE